LGSICVHLHTYYIWEGTIVALVHISHLYEHLIVII
jgi:hypothetical protein